MAVDLYVGSISRYLAGDWQTESQQLLAEAGATGAVQPWHADGWQPLGRDEALASAVAWRDQAIAEAERAESDLPTTVTPWHEDPDSPYAVKRLSPDAISALTLILFYEDLRDLPDRVPNPLGSDPRVAAKQHDLEHLVAASSLACDIWIPGDFLVSHGIAWPRYTDSSKARVGSLALLKIVLNQIESASWPDLPEALHQFASLTTTLVSTQTRGVWPFRRKVEERQESLYLLAVQTLDRMKAMAAIAIERNLPMIRDR